MNEFEERRGQSPFYAIMAILTLVVAAVGATFAYFSLTASSANVTGNIARVGLSMDVELKTETQTDLIPLRAEFLKTAVTEDAEKNRGVCQDEDGRTVCQIYQITVSNMGNTEVTVNGSLNFAKSETSLPNDKITNLRWVLMDSLTSITTEEIPTDHTFGNVAFASAGVEADTELATNVQIGATEDPEVAKESVTYYLLVWLDDTGEEKQEELDKGGFTGTIVFNDASGNGSGITGTFTVTP